MGKFLLFFSFFLAFECVQAAEMDVCIKSLRSAKPMMHIKDVEMLCRDPYLKGLPNESKEDQARRERLLGKTEEDKEWMVRDLKDLKVEPKKVGIYIQKNDVSGCVDMFVGKGKDAKDAEMLCRDPFLKGLPGETKSDRARRDRLLKETETDKELMLGDAIRKSEVGKAVRNEKKDNDQSDSAAALKSCKKMQMDADPGRDPLDAEMLCNDPYLKGKSGESYNDQVRRKRLIKETDQAMEKHLDKHVAPPATREVKAEAVK